MIRRASVLLAALASLGNAATQASPIYVVPEISLVDGVGAWDVNIMADDVHFETASIIREIRLPLSIAGSQSCQLWIFDSLNHPALHTLVFTNQPTTNQYMPVVHVIEMQVQVPRDIYIGFSAQGGGWGSTASDYWIWGTNVNAGVAGTPGRYYYGTVTGGQLTAEFAPNNTVNATNSFGRLEIISEPVRLDAVAVAGGQVHLSVENLPIHATNTVEWNAAAGSTNWAAVATLPAGASNHVWTGAAPVTSAFYRVQTR